MTTAVQHKPMSEILAPSPDVAAKTDEPVPTPDPVVEEPTKSTLPEKYVGKTAEEIADMHMNAEQELGRVRNELGTSRGLVQDLQGLVRTTTPVEEVTEEDVTLTGDQMLTDPVGAVRQVLQHDLSKRDAEQATSDAATQVSDEIKALDQEFGDYTALVTSKPFVEFAARTPSRQTDFQTAAYGTGLAQVRAARRLLEDYTDFAKATTKEQPKTEETTETNEPIAAVDAARAVATESGNSSAPISSKPQVFESDVLVMIDKDPARYRSPSYQKELTDAIRENRFVKNT